MSGRIRCGTWLAAAIAALAIAPPALGDFPYTRPGGDPQDFTDLYLTNQLPNDFCGDGNEFKFSASANPQNIVSNNRPGELNGVRGAHVGDEAIPGDCGTTASAKPTAWKLTLGRPDVTIAVLDSGIKWNDPSAMNELRLKVHLNRGELPVPQHDLGTAISNPGTNNCASYTSSYDANGDGVFNIDDYACDSRVANVLNGSTVRVGPNGVLVPQDLIIAFSNGTDSDSNAFVDDIAGWDFLDDDNDPFDDVQYGHGTGEAQDSSAEANNTDQAGSCPNCMVEPLRVGDSFIADVNRFAAAVLYATDNNIDVVQEALGTLNNSSLSRSAVDYAYDHGVTVIASAADEAAQHNNWPSSLPHVILVNSVRDTGVPPPDDSYLAINGCTNFNAKITLAIPSTSCSSNATGLAAGMAGLVYSAALDARDEGVLSNYPDQLQCRRTNGAPCLITPNEVRQVMASGVVGGNGQADDVNFASPTGEPEPSCSPVAAPNCTDPNGALQTQVDVHRQVPLPDSRSYPARKGPDQFYGYGRVNAQKAISALLSDPQNPAQSKVPPEAEITSPQWFEQVDPSNSSLEVDGQVFARGSQYTCEVLVAPGQYPNNSRTPTGDFASLGNGWCNGSTQHSDDHSGALGTISLAQLKARFPAGTNFTGPEPQPSPANGNGRPNAAPHAFTVEVLVHSTQGGVAMTGQDRRAAYLHRDSSMITGFPKGIRRGVISNGTPTGDGESSPVLADLDGDNRNELIVAGSDGFVHAIRRDGTELPGWPVRGEQPVVVAHHTGARAYQSGEVSTNEGGAILGSVAVGDVNGDGIPEVFVDDMEGKMYGWNADGQRIFTEESDPAFSGKPLQPFHNVRYEPGQSEFRRTQHGFISSPVLADLNGDGQLEVIVGGMDRHVYAWSSDDSDPDNPGGAADMPGFPLLVVDPSKVQSIDPQTDAVTFKPNSGAQMQGAIVDTPALADLNGDGKPEIVIGTNEEYEAQQDGGWNAAPANGSSLNLLDQALLFDEAFQQQCRQQFNDPHCNDVPDVPLSPANSRVYAIHPDGDAHADGPFLSGWPARLAIINSELLPVVGEGVTGYPIVGRANCGNGGGPKVGAMPNNGAAYIFGKNGKSCYGQDGNGADIPLQTDGYANQPDHPMLPAVGSPAFSDLDGAGLDFVAPAAGLGRALDVALPEYQITGQDFISAWTVQGGGQIRPNYPQTVNDLQFLTGPSMADIDGVPGQEIVEGSASMDLAAYSAAGNELPGWPKLSTDWTVANPTIGSLGTHDTDPGAKLVVIGETRSGYINAYKMPASACSPATWPRFHHDDANSGDYERDATLPGKPYLPSVTSSKISFVAPGDDLLCGTADHYEIATSDTPIDEGSFDQADALSGAPTPKQAGTTQSYSPPAGAKRYVAIRAVDEQGNVGRVLNVDFRKPAPPPPPKPCSNRIEGTGGDDVLKGTNRGDRILAKAGNDRVAAHGGQDCLRGNGGRDKLRGGRGKDHIGDGSGRDLDRGGADDDVIDGGPARDHVFGAGGDDRIDVAGGGRDSVECGSGHDTVDASARDQIAGDCETVR
jgi:hypothetical protein